MTDHNQNDDAPIFFPKNNPVSIECYFDTKEDAFVAKAKIAETGESLFEAVGEDLGEALDQIVTQMDLLCEKPEMFNERLSRIGMSLRKPSKKDPGKKIYRLR